MEKTLEEMQNEMLQNYASLTKNEQDYIKLFGNYSDTQLMCRIEDNTMQQMEGYVPWWYERSLLGSKFKTIKKKQKLVEQELPRIIKAIERGNSRKKWGELRKYSLLKDAKRRGDVNNFIYAVFLTDLSDEDKYAFDAYYNEPTFSVGQIVEFRSNVGCDSVIRAREYNHGAKYWYGVGKSELRRAKEKTFMIIEVDPFIDGKVYSRLYSYKQKQGGSRFYKVLPMGEAKTYYVVEKFLKKCRTKAVKDAKK